eukprot:TRINITY_DN3899_c0_g1_i2.p1 TRINITY_DN3899_c0_g1~~TRINITY_DN3899_c0_g1_i2.p1  ORF type:complete len:186 (-),score=42.90 TRINITY_DN3899_c0_g1_i2:70-627(-)
MAKLKEEGKTIFLFSLGTVVVGKFKAEEGSFILKLLDTILETAQQRPEIEFYGVLLGLGSWLQVLPHVDVFLTHGGANSFNEALYLGKPLIVIPFFGDQLGNAQVAEDVGVGYYFKHDEGVQISFQTDPQRKSVTTENMKAAIDFCLSAPVREKAHALSLEFQKRTTPALVGELIDWLKAKQPGH